MIISTLKPFLSQKAMFFGFESIVTFSAFLARLRSEILSVITQLTSEKYICLFPNKSLINLPVQISLLKPKVLENALSSKILSFLIIDSIIKFNDAEANINL